MRISKYDIRKLRRVVKRILIIYWGVLGDILVTTPFIEALRKGFPRAHISFLVGKTGGTYSDPTKLLERNPNVDRCFRPDVSILAKLLTDEPYDLAIDLFGSRTSQLIARASGAKVRLSGKFRYMPASFSYSDCLGGEYSPFTEIPLRNNIDIKKDSYRADQFLELARFLGLSIKKAAWPRIYLSPEEKHSAKRYLKDIGDEGAKTIIAIQPGGGAPGRLWEARNYAALADRLIERYDAKVIILYGSGEERCADRVCKAARHRLAAVFKRDIRKYISMIAGSSVFISSDGGPLHIALSLGVPSVGIFKERPNAAYWYNYKKRKGLFSVFVKADRCAGRKNDTKEVALVLKKAKEALGFKRL